MLAVVSAIKPSIAINSRANVVIINSPRYIGNPVRQNFSRAPYVFSVGPKSRGGGTSGDVGDNFSRTPNLPGDEL